MTADALGGVWSYALELARALAPQRVRVTLATMGAPPSAAQRAAAAALGVELRVSELRLEWMDEPWEDVARAGAWLLALERELSPDLVQLNGYAHGALPWRAPVVVVAHSDVCSWWRAVRGEAAPPAWDRYRAAVRAGLDGAALVVAPTRAMLRALEAEHGAVRAGAVIPNAADAARFAPGVKEPFVLTAGRLWDEAKNVAALGRVAPQLPWPVWVAGDARHPDGGAAATGGLRPLGRLAQPALAAWLGRAAVYALPARYEPFGLSALEAALAGCALVLGDIPSLREVWGDAALYVAPDDDDALAAALLALAGDERARARLARRARRRALTYDPERMAHAYLAAYRTVLGRPAAAGTPRPRARAGPPPDDTIPPDADDPRTISAPLHPLSRMRIVLFCHSLRSDWNHGNAHFLRGVVAELLAGGHQVAVYEPRDAWSVQRLVADHGEAALAGFARAYPGLASERYDLATLDLDAALDGADLVLVHEWNDHDLVRRVGEHRARSGGYRLLFHDTHHRSATKPQEMRAYDLSHYDGVLAFGDVVRDLYLREGWARRAWTWHEAADVRVFRPLPGRPREGDLVWVGNWGDDERTGELREFLVEPVRALGLRARVHGVRYPREAVATLADAGIDYAGWLPNYEAPELFARFGVTVHVPRRPYARSLPGIPTIRVFEALACGIPLVSAPWEDREGLFTPGADFLVARDGAEMRRHLRDVLGDPALARALAEHGRRTVLARHSCAHRVRELLAIYTELGAPPARRAAAATTATTAAAHATVPAAGAARGAAVRA